MVDVELNGAMNQSNGETNTGVNQKIPGGKQSKLLNEPHLSDASTDPKMGCTNSTPDGEVPSSTEVKPEPKTYQPPITAFYSSVGKKDESGGKTSNSHSPKRSNFDSDGIDKKRPKSKNSADNMSDNDDSENRTAQPSSDRSTRSSKSLPKLRETFSDSDGGDDNNSRYSSWAKQDISEYRSNYPNRRQNLSVNDNYQFYTNQISSYPNGDFIDSIHKKWFGDYRELEFHHGYIQWLFPLQEKGLNWSAEPLQKHEIELIKKDSKALKRILKSYKLMLDFYGFELVDEKSGKLRRLAKDAYKERFRNLNTSSHNYLRITRILKCLGEFNYEYLKFPFLEAILRECITENTLGNCLRSCKDYWIETLRSQKERRAIRQYARELIEYRNKQIDPPPSHQAHRPTTATKVELMCTSHDEDDQFN